MTIGFGAAKCPWMVLQTASKSSQYSLAFVMLLGSVQFHPQT